MSSLLTTGIMKNGWTRGRRRRRRRPLVRETSTADRELPHVSGNVALTQPLACPSSTATQSRKKVHNLVNGPLNDLQRCSVRSRLIYVYSNRKHFEQETILKKFQCTRFEPGAILSRVAHHLRESSKNDPRVNFLAIAGD
ncbi:uncharacterized protein LOC143143763 isoform X2 [Ptiloglossa arizonensis]|uniref:uncharacterized protein LOC143143763 isoform X2 n=1 Tax=Ptiloglossa arizonensis TaxID=3350558 RepID=UPI003FA164AF